MGIYIALGANMPSQIKGETRSVLDGLKYVETHLCAAKTVSVLRKSNYWKNPSWPYDQGHPDFLNAVWEIETELEPLALLVFLKTIEVAFGRSPSQRNAPRPLDLDIIDYNSRRIETKDLSLPHPRIGQRAFVLFPLAEIAPHWTHPKSGQKIWEAIARLPLKDAEKCSPS